MPNRALRCRRQIHRTVTLLATDSVKNSSRRIFPTAQAVRTPIVQKASLHTRPLAGTWATWHSRLRQQRSFHASSSAQVVKPFLLADIGEGITECEVIQWFVEPGATVAEFDKICEVQSDKASVEITSRFAGKVLKLYYDVNEVAKVGSPLVDIEVEGEEGEEAPTPASVQTVEADAQVTPPSTPSPTRELKDPSLLSLATPAVRRIAKQNNIDIKLVSGTGKDGRVLKEDVMAYISNGGNKSPEAQAQPAPSTPPPVAPVFSSGDHTQPLTAIQKAMFKSMTKSVAIPQLGYKDEMELNATTEYRAALNKHISANATVYPFKKISYMPIFIKCLSIALSHYPVMNATIIGGDVTDVNSIQLQYRQSHNIGIAMDTPQGLIVPNIKDVQNKTILDVAHEIHRLSELGGKNSIPPADLQGGTITVSNIGTIGGTYANPCLVSSEMGIVALGRMQTLPRFDEAGNVVAKQILPVSWSADHRIIDGATIARFGNYWKNLIENPVLLSSELR